MKTVLLKAPGFLGDEVVFTGVVRELKKETGWHFRVDTRRPELWSYNDCIQGIGIGGKEDILLQNDYCPPYYAASQTPVHYLECYLGELRSVLGLTGPYRISRFAGEVQPSPEEMIEPPFDLPQRYWLIVAGWKTGVPTKAWPMANYQRVVDLMGDRINFVQAGARSSWHPPLRGVRNVVGQTDVRRLISLLYHAEGVLCPITSIMHLAAAVPASKKSGFELRPCVVIAGGREVPHYITYPMHRVLSMVGQLHCCATGGCGKSRFGAGQCPYPERVVNDDVPKCMTLIKPEDVVHSIEFFYRGKVRL
jgi:ADP-heptose:LPS heptosyltransferase